LLSRTGTTPGDPSAATPRGEALAVRWGSAPRDHLGKTVWAEVLPHPLEKDRLDL